MKPAQYFISIGSAGYLAGLIAGLLLLVTGVSARPAIEDQQASADSAVRLLNIDIDNGLVTLDAQDVRLEQILDAIALRSALLVVSIEPLDARMTLNFERLPLHQALKRIMRQRSYLLIEAERNSDENKVSQPARSILRIFNDSSANQPRDGQLSDRRNSNTEVPLEVLKSQLTSDKRRTRKDAIKGLKKLASAQAIAALSFALVDEDREIRVKAIQALADIGGDDATIALAAAAGDEHPGVRAEAAYALGTLGGQTAIGVLKQALYDADSDVREAAIDALAEALNEE